MLDPASKAQESEGLFDPSFTISGSTEHGAAAAASHGPRESGESTPPLWRSTSPARRQSRYRSLSPASKAQAIARGQRELMEMVRTMPEGCYELSLRDMVEKPWARPSDLDLNHQEENLNLNLIGSLVAPKEEEAMRRRSGSGGKMVRSGSVEAERGGGFLLKMVFPVPVGSARSKRKVRSNSAKSKSKSAASDSSVKSKVSPKPSEDKDWWKRKIPILEESESTRSSSRSSTSSSAGGAGSRRSNRASTTRRGRSILPSCCSFLRPKKSELPQPKNGLQEL